jgi:hypothetical protein
MIIIHHGPGVQSGIGEYVNELNLTQVKEAYEKLNAEEIRNLCEDLKQSYPYQNPCLIAGPIDDADPSQLDTLLKIIEEPLPNTPIPILWANDFGAIPNTIRSRCGERYWFDNQTEHPMLDKALEFVNALNSKDSYKSFSILKSVDKSKERDFIDALAEALVVKKQFKLWDTIKPYTLSKRVSRIGLYSLFIELEENK